MGEYFLPLLGHFGFKDYLKATPDVPDSDVTVDFCARHNWIVGSPATVAEKIETIWREVGGFGTLLVFGFDYKHKPEAWHNSLRLLKQDVMPRLNTSTRIWSARPDVGSRSGGALAPPRPLAVTPTGYSDGYSNPSRRCAGMMAGKAIGKHFVVS